MKRKMFGLFAFAVILPSTLITAADTKTAKSVIEVTQIEPQLPTALSAQTSLKKKPKATKPFIPAKTETASSETAGSEGSARPIPQAVPQEITSDAIAVETPEIITPADVVASTPTVPSVIESTAPIMEVPGSTVPLSPSDLELSTPTPLTPIPELAPRLEPGATEPIRNPADSLPSGGHEIRREEKSK